MAFVDEIIKLETSQSNDDYIILEGNNPILITAPHTIEHQNEDGTIKLREPFTKAIALYIAKKLNLYAIVKVGDKNTNPNIDTPDKMKDKIIDTINKNNILLSLDIHGAAKERDFDVELGTINNISADYSTINELKEALTENGIKNIIINEPFKGGAITRTIYGQTDAEAIQIEINGKYRDIKDIDKIEKVCESLENFINQYLNVINK